MAYADFIPENVAPSNARRIGIYDSNGNRVGQIPLGSLAFPDVGAKLYSFGALSDVHVTYQTGESDFINALKYFNTQTDVEFICLAGDLATVGTDDNLSRYRNLVDANSPNLPIYVSAGNHDSYDANWAFRPDAEVSASMLTYTGNPLYYSFERGDDVFIFVGVCNGIFSKAELQWLYETLEANRNKRCFVFEHVFPWDGSGDVLDAYGTNLLTGTYSSVFLSLMRHYKNVLWFHGHSHVKFDGQLYGDMANIDRLYGMYSLHIPSLASPAEGDADRGYIYADSEGYLVDVYENGIHLRGRDFVKGEFLPIASYWLDTTLQTIPAGTYTDITGTITK